MSVRHLAMGVAGSALGVACLAPLSGCMCVDKVQRIGVHSTALQPVRIWTNDLGDRALECRVADVHEATASRRNLGARFIRAPRSAWSNAVGAVDAKRGVDRDGPVSVELVARLAAENEDDFLLVPSDVRQRHLAAAPDESGGWAFAEQDAARWGGCAGYVEMLGPRTVEVVICSASLAWPESQYRTRWGSAAQLLLIVPAFVVDVITAPVQVVIILNELSRI